jgi:hydrogenase nickel incorporation protein HypA/HybF
MHEFGIAKALVENVVAEAEKNNARSVSEVIVELGELSFVGKDQFKFAYGILAKEIAIIERSILTIIDIDAVVSCEACGYNGPLQRFDEPETHFITPMFACPKCSGKVKIERGRECTIKNIRMEVE